MGWDGYIDVRGNRYSVPGHLCGKRVQLRIGLDGSLRVYADGELVVESLLRGRSEGWVTVPEHHQALWEEALDVERRPLDVYAEAASWS
ncbi:MAG: hypothetical protein H6642_09150 [Caldilineaceae bacterium]|nr:hypothetical protein [Caldilineaceae bacterium]